MFLPTTQGGVRIIYTQHGIKVVRAQIFHKILIKSRYIFVILFVENEYIARKLVQVRRFLIDSVQSSVDQVRAA